jgi:MoaA/NifB/PqqE/SkfB family radical SAM enzyme
VIHPKQFIVETTNRCNLQCRYCPSVDNTGKFPVGDMDVEFFKSIIDRIAIESPESTVIPWANGEPFLHPKYLQMMQYLNSKGLRFYITTNLTIWREDVLRELLKPGSGCYQLIVSMDGIFGSGNIAKARPGTDEELLRRNIGRLFALKAEMASETDLAFKICRRGQDYGEVERYIQYWLENPDLDFVIVGDALVGENEDIMRTEPCQYFDNNFMVIRWTGDVTLCAYCDKAVNELEGSYGKVDMANSLLGIYNCQEIESRRQEQKNGIFASPCNTCPIAYSGIGFKGKISFRDDPGTEYWYQRDYYNQFFSKKLRWKPNSYYGGKDAQETGSQDRG